ncbi:MAG: conserved protein of unknown function [Nitrospira sp.]
MTHEEIEDTVPLYATGALDRAERQTLEAHLLSGCASCHHALKEYQAVAAILPLGLVQTAPVRTLKAKIMASRNPVAAALEDGQTDEPKPSLEPGEWMNHLFPPITPARSVSLPWAIGIAAVLLVTVAGYLGWTFTTRLSSDTAKIEQLEVALQDQTTKLVSLQRVIAERDRSFAALERDSERRAHDIAELKEQLIARETELEGLEQQLASRTTVAGRARTPQDELAVLLRQPNIRVVSLGGSEMARNASGILLYDAKTQKVWLYAVNLPECLNGTMYQLWAIDQKPKSLGTFHMDSGETAHLMVKRLPDFERTKKFAVSLEPPGGRPQPTGALYLVSQS